MTSYSFSYTCWQFMYLLWRNIHIQFPCFNWVVFKLLCMIFIISGAVLLSDISFGNISSHSVCFFPSSFFCWWCLIVISKNPFPTPKSQRFMTAFFWEFTVLAVTIVPVIHFEFIYVYYFTWSVQILCFACGYPGNLAPFVEDYCFSISYLAILVETCGS